MSTSLSRSRFLAGATALLLAGLPNGAVGQVDIPDPSVPPNVGAGVHAPGSIGPSREALLDTLYQRLQQAETSDRAEAVAESIRRIWRNSGSPSIDLLVARATSLIRAEEYNLALAILDTAVVSEPTFAEGWSQRAMVYFQKRDFRAALRDLRRVLALEPKHFRAMHGVAVILNEFGEKERALQAYRRALEIYPLNSEARDAVEELQREVEGQDI